MTIRKRQGNRPDRRIAAAGFADCATKEELLERLRYVGSSNHKLHPGNYGFAPPQNPRPSKSACDEIRAILLEEAAELFRSGIRLGMFSEFTAGGVPKYVWAVDDAGEAYEAKTRPERETDYHGYRLGEDDRPMREYLRKEWKLRCR
jgi:hypothetical protein